ncbi:MAG: dicarboxylate/amino acid:cation symporter [Planctomycetota bacterium]
MAAATATGAQAQGRGSHRLLVAIVIGTVAGALFGGFAPAAAGEVAFIGTIFINLLKVMVVPLVITSMIVGIAGIGDVRHLGSFGGKVLAYFFATTFLAVLVGMVLVNAIRPGVGYTHYDAAVFEAAGLTPAAGGGGGWTAQDPALAGCADELSKGTIAEDRALITLTAGWQENDPRFEALNGALDRYAASCTHTGRAGFLERIWSDKSARAGLEFTVKKAGAAGAKTAAQVATHTLTPEEGAQALLKLRTQDENALPLNAVKSVFESMVPTNIVKAATTDGSEMLSLIVFGIFFGIVAVTLGVKAKPALDLVTSLNDIIMAMVHVVIWTAPVGIFALVAGKIGAEGGFAGFMPLLVKLGWYALTVVVGLVIHGLILLPLIVWLVARRNPLRFIGQMGRALVLAFTTSSSSATLPVTIECAAENAGISRRSREFVLPLGATINMNGTALYEAVAVLFIAQIYGLHLGLGQQIVLFLTATLAAVGAAGIPEAGLVTMVMVMTTVGVPVEGMSFILVIDWILDRCRTTVNVWGDMVGAAVLDRWEPPLAERAAGPTPSATVPPTTV